MVSDHKREMIEIAMREAHPVACSGDWDMCEEDYTSISKVLKAKGVDLDADYILEDGEVYHRVGLCQYGRKVKDLAEVCADHCHIDSDTKRAVSAA